MRLDEPARVSRDLDDLIDAYVSSALRASGMAGDHEPAKPGLLEAPVLERLVEPEPPRVETAPVFTIEDDTTHDEQPAYMPRIRFARGSVSAPMFELDLDDEVTNVVARPVP